MEKEIGGEGNGGVIYPELHSGRDAIVGIALFLTHLAKSLKKCSELRSMYPNYYISKNKIEFKPEIDPDVVLSRLKDSYIARNIDVNTVDGIKIEFENEWVHLRKSNTETVIRIYCESTSQDSAEELAQKFVKEILALI